MRYEPLLQFGTVFRITDGPVAASGYWWYEIRLDEFRLRGGRTTGWLAAGDHDGTPWIGSFPAAPGVDTGTDHGDDPEPEWVTDPPTPVLTLDGMEEYTGSDGVRYTRYVLSVANWEDFPAELFEAAADYEPWLLCGDSPDGHAGRTWVAIADGD